MRVGPSRLILNWIRGVLRRMSKVVWELVAFGPRGVSTRRMGSRLGFSPRIAVFVNVYSAKGVSLLCNDSAGWNVFHCFECTASLLYIRVVSYRHEKHVRTLVLANLGRECGLLPRSYCKQLDLVRSTEN